MNALMHFPIKSGKCPQDYEKIPTYDCLNWAPALLETTCCIYKRPVAVADPQRRASTLCDQNTRIDAAVQGCDGNIYLFSSSLVWRVNANFELTSDEPLELMSFSMGSIINPDTRVEAAIVRGDCTLDLFTNERVGGSQSFVNIDLAKLTPMASGEVGVTAPYDNLVNKYVQAGISLSKAGVAVAHVNILFSGVDEDVSAGQQADAMIENWLIGGAHTASVSHENLDWATDYSGKPLPITAGFYEPNRDLIYIITDDNKQELWTFRRDGKKMSGTPQKLQEVLNICNPGGRLGDHGEDDDESVVVYIPLPVPPQPYPQYQQNPEA